jgi:hypothetical protein
MQPEQTTEPVIAERGVGATGPPSGQPGADAATDASNPPVAATGADAPPTPKANQRGTTEPDRGPFFTGTWQGRAIYRCPICGVAKTDRDSLAGDAAVRLHLERQHIPERTPEERARAAGLVISKR